MKQLVFPWFRDVAPDLDDVPTPPKVPQMRINDLVLDAHRHALSKGFWESADCQEARHSIYRALAFIHSEVSEAFEAIRDGEMKTTTLESGKPVGLPVEIADVVIVACDLAGWLGIDLEAEVRRKMAFNQTRPDRHGRNI